MPKKRREPSKKKLQKNNAETMREAVEEVMKGASLRTVGERMKIPFQTLHRYVKKQKGSETPIRMTPNYEVNRIFTAEQEESQIQYIVTCAKMFYGLPLRECRQQF